MLLRKFRKSIIKNKIDKILFKSKLNNDVAGKKIDSVLILIDEKMNSDLIQVVAEKVSIDIEKIKVLFFRESKNEAKLFEYSFSEKDFSLLGNVKNKNVQNLIKKEFGLLLNYIEGNMHVDCIIALSKARFKVGLSSKKQELYDLVIAVDACDVDLFNSELEKYLKILNKI